MHRANIKQHRSLFSNQNFKEGSLALTFSKKKTFFFLQGGWEAYILLFAVPDVPNVVRTVGQAVKDISLPVGSFLREERGDSVVPGPRGTPRGPLRESQNELTHFTCLSGLVLTVHTRPGSTPTHTRVRRGAGPVSCSNDLPRDDSPGASFS